jgi:hypothetical protein
MIPDYDIQIYRKISGICTRIDNNATYVNPPPQNTTPDDIHEFLLSELIKIKATQTVSGQVAEAEVSFDNDPTKRFEAGDIILIWLGFEATGSVLQKVFSGVVYEAAKTSDDEDKTLTLRARDWSFLLLTDKFTQSYPETEYATQIVLDILSSFTPSFFEEGHWHINEGSGTLITDSSYFGRDGTYEDLLNPGLAPTWVSGKLGNALYFQSSQTGSVTCGDITDFDWNTPFSVEFWFWMDSSKLETDWAGIFPLISKYSGTPFTGWTIFEQDGLNLNIVLSSNGLTGNRILLTLTEGVYPCSWLNSAWHHLVMTYDGSGVASGIKLYIDNTLKAPLVVEDNLTASILNTEPLRFGSNTIADHLYYTKLDEIVLYSGVLSTSEIAIRWNGGTGTEEPLATEKCNLNISAVIGTDHIEDLIPRPTRQLDFDGEPLIDAMTKVSDATEHDWYIDEEKMARWFKRRDTVGHIQYRDDPPTIPLVLYREDLTDYDVTDPEELLCNKVKVYGRDNKVIPWDYDRWSDSLGGGSLPFVWTGLLTCSCTLQPAPPTPKAGTNSIKISGATTGSWWIWNHPDGWCHTPVLFGPGSLEVEFSLGCSSGKKMRLHSAGCFHTGTGHVEVYYKWGSGGTYVRLLYPDDNITDEYQDLFPYLPPGPPDYVEGPTDTDLYIKYKLTGMGLYSTGCMNNFTVYYADNSVAGTEKFSARLTIPSPVVIWTDGGTAFWSLISGSAEDDSEEMKKGSSSYKVILSTQTLDFYHNYSVDQNYSSASKPNIGFWLYGQNTGSTIDIEFSKAVYVPVMIDGYRYQITDNFVGWKWFEPARADFATIGGYTGWDHIRSIRFHGSGNVTATYRLDWLVNSNPLDEIVDLETKASAKSFKFVAAPHYGNFPTGISQLVVRFIFADGNTATTQVQFSGMTSDNWTTIEIPVGEDADGWTGNCVGTLQSIEFELTATFGGVPAVGDYLLIDWIHFDQARWYGEYEDATSEFGNGVRFKELFDETLYSDTAAARRALEFVVKYKDPIITIKNVEAEYIGMENLDPGKVLVVDNSVPEFADMTLDNRSYRIETIIHHIEENDYYVDLILSLDPIYFEGNVYQISERVRRIEQKGRRKPAENPTEVD